MEPLLYLLPTVVLFSILIFFSAKERKRNQESWRQIAEELGLSYLETDSYDLGRVVGTYQGKRVSIDARVQGGVKSKRVYTLVQTHGAFSQLKGLELSKKNLAKSLPPPVANYLKDVVGQLESALGDESDLLIDEKSICFVSRGVTEKAEVIRWMLGVQLELSKRLV